MKYEMIIISGSIFSKTIRLLHYDSEETRLDEVVNFHDALKYVENYCTVNEFNMHPETAEGLFIYHLTKHGH